MFYHFFCPLKHTKIKHTHTHTHTLMYGFPGFPGTPAGAPGSPPGSALGRLGRVGDGRRRPEKVRVGEGYPVVVINWVQYLGPPGPFSFPDSRDLLEVLGRTFLGREREP